MEDHARGFFAPVHRALTEPILLGGAPRAVAILNGTLAGAVGHAALLRLVVRQPDELGIDVDAEPARLVLLSRREHDDAVARAQIHHEIVRADLRHAQHLVHHDLRGGHVGPAGALQLDVGGRSEASEGECAEGEQYSAPHRKVIGFHGTFTPTLSLPSRGGGNRYGTRVALQRTVAPLPARASPLILPSWTVPV